MGTFAASRVEFFFCLRVGPELFGGLDDVGKLPLDVLFRDLVAFRVGGEAALRADADSGVGRSVCTRGIPYVGGCVLVQGFFDSSLLDTVRDDLGGIVHLALQHFLVFELGVK